MGEGGPAGEDSRERSDDGRVLRPEYVVLGEEAVVPAANVVRPPPNRFTHELVADEPYYFDRPEHGPEPDGVLPAGTKVVLLVQDNGSCRVVSGSGLYVRVRRASLRELPGRRI
jgi:hypothetical protein